MSTKNSTRIILIATLAACSVVAAAQQNQNQNSNQTNQTNQNQNQPQNQPAQQPQQKKSVWQKLRDANSAIQGQGTTQGTTQQGGTVQQQAGQQIQQVQQTGQQVQQGMQGVQQQLPANGSQMNQSGGGSSGSCGSSCFDAGPFQASVSQMTMTQEGGWHVVRMNIMFHNSTNQPLIIAYHDGSMMMIDNNGNSYIPAGGNPGQLQGMGIDRGNQTDSQFVLAPGQTSNAMFSVARNRAQNSPVGTGYTYNLTIDELQAQNGAMAIPIRTYNLNFPSLTPGTNNNAAFASSTPNGSAGGSQGNGAVTSQAKTGSGTPATTTKPAATATTSAPMVNAAMKTPVTTTKTSAATAAAKPIPATTATKPTTTTAPKKTPPTTTTTAK